MKATRRFNRKITSYATTSSASSLNCSSLKANILNRRQTLSYPILNPLVRQRKYRHRLLRWVHQRQINYVRRFRFESLLSLSYIRPSSSRLGSWDSLQIGMLTLICKGASAAHAVADMSGNRHPRNEPSYPQGPPDNRPRGGDDPEMRPSTEPSHVDNRSVAV